MRIVAIVLTLNEEKHLARCIDSVKSIATDIVVADSFSTDATIEIARSHGARIVQREWVNYAKQFNWALTQIDADIDWILRIDADEYLTQKLAAEIKDRLPSLGPEIDGAYFDRQMTFQGRLIRYGGLSKNQVLRLFRNGRGQCENRWMDEHIKVTGATANLRGELIDDNLNSLTWWINKHNGYASREAVDLLNLEFQFMPFDSVASLSNGGTPGKKRWVKEVIYARLPGGVRAFAYFVYRYVIRLGFLDGQAGAAFHLFQGFWYRYLVDAKIAEVRRYMEAKHVGVVEAIEAVLAVSLKSLQAGDAD